MLQINQDKGSSPILYEVRKSKHLYEYQELCEELAKVYGRLVWTLPHKVGFTEHKIRRAHQIASERGITKFAYLVGIIKKL